MQPFHQFAHAPPVFFRKLEYYVKDPKTEELKFDEYIEKTVKEELADLSKLPEKKRLEEETKRAKPAFGSRTYLLIVI